MSQGFQSDAFQGGAFQAIPIAKSSRKAFINARGEDGSLLALPKPVYTCGSLQILDSVSSYVRGSLHPNSYAPVYIRGKNYTKSNAWVFTNATHILTYVSTSVFLTGVSLNRSYAHAFISGEYAAKSSVASYLSGIIRSSAKCFIMGLLTSSKYIWLKTSDSGKTLSKRFLVLQSGYVKGEKERVEEVNKTISGGLDHSLGSIYTRWRMAIRVSHTGENPQDGTVSDLEYFFSLNDPNAVPSNIITFTDHYGEDHSVIMIGNMNKNLMTTAVEGKEALFIYRLELIK